MRSVADTHRAPYLPNAKAYELQTWYTAGPPRSKVDVTRSRVSLSSVGQMAHKSKTTKLAAGYPTTRATLRTSFKVIRSGSQAD